MELVSLLHCHHVSHIPSRPSAAVSPNRNSPTRSVGNHQERPFSRSLKLALVPLALRPNTSSLRRSSTLTTVAASATGGVPLPPLDLTEDNVRQVLADARVEFGQIFDTSVGITGRAELAELDGPFVKISLKGRFWHERSIVLARIGNYLKQRIPEILEVDIEDEKQLDDSPENF